MKAPATQLYWKEWTTDLALGRCSWAARGVWMHVLAALHQSEEYGVLRWPLKEIASSANVPMRYLRELVDKNVLKGSDNFVSPFMHVPRHAGQKLPEVLLVPADGGPCWFSARFVRDEWGRGRRGMGSRFTSDNQPGRTPDGRMGEPQGDGPAFAFASASAGIDKSLREDRSPGGADDLARALREIGYSECSAFVPELKEAKAAGVTAEQIADIAKANQGKSIAYIAATAIGKLQDKQRKQATDTQGQQPPAVDHLAMAKREELRHVEDELIDLRHQRDTSKRITPEEFAARAAPLLVVQATLQKELQPAPAMGVSA
jgi:hypothetical protein